MKQLKPILIEIDNESNIFRKKGSDLLEYIPDNCYQGAYVGYSIILIDTEQGIVEGSYYFANQGVRKCIRINKESYNSCPYIHLNRDGEEMGDFHTWKNNVVAISEGTTSPDNIEINLPQLAPQSIQLLINYYNKYRCMPESVEVEEVSKGNWVTCKVHDGKLGEECTICREFIYCTDQECECGFKLKLNEQGKVDITIPTKHSDTVCPKCGDRMKPLTKSDRCVNGQCGYEVNITIPKCDIDNTLDAFAQSSNKLIDNAKVKEKLYTEEEIYKMIEECNSRDGLDYNDMKEWFKQNKKNNYESRNI